MAGEHTTKTIETANAAIVVAALLSFVLASTFIFCVYGYMDHINTVVSLKVGQHDTRCLHQSCTLSEAAR